MIDLENDALQHAAGGVLPPGSYSDEATWLAELMFDRWLKNIGREAPQPIGDVTT